jgi:hypothetical protein
MLYRCPPGSLKRVNFISAIEGGPAGYWYIHHLIELKCAPGGRDLGQLKAKILRGRQLAQGLVRTSSYRYLRLHSLGRVKHPRILE